MFEVQLFLNLVMQSEQPIGKFSIIRAPETTDQRETKVYMALDQGRNTDRLDHRDFLISGGLDREELSLVLLNWLGASDDERNARRRFLKGFCQRSNFSVDRFIGAAPTAKFLASRG
jgi:hypothetical protein